MDGSSCAPLYKVNNNSKSLNRSILTAMVALCGEVKPRSSFLAAS